MSSLRQKTVSGVVWTGMAKMSMQLVLFIIMAILARLLTKDDFGIVGMAAIITVAVAMVNDKGLGMSIIQKKELPQSHLSTMFWAGVLFGVFLYLLSLGLSFPLALFFRKDIVQPVSAIIALGFAIGGFGIVQKSLLTRDMAFKKLALVELSATLCSGLLAILMALLGCGVWSLAANVLARDLITVFGLWMICKWRPNCHFSVAELKEYIGFSGNVLANDGAIYLITNVDVAIVGRMLGSVSLGVYNLALWVVKLPVTRLSSIVAKVVFPAFSSLQHDIEKFKAAYLKAIKYISLITFPILATLAVYAREFIVVVPGEKWLDMTWPLIILTPMAMLKSVGTIKSSVLMAVGRPDIELKWNLLYLVPLTAVVYAGAHYGLIGVALAFTILYVLTFPIIQHVTNKQIAVTAYEFFGALYPSLLAAAVLVIFGLVARYLLKVVFTLPDVVVLIAGICGAGATFLLVLWKIDRTVLLELRGMLLRNGGYTKVKVAVSE